MANVLFVSIETFESPIIAGNDQLLVVTTADRYFHALIPGSSLSPYVSRNDLHDSAILSAAFLSSTRPIAITASMSGQVLVHNLEDGKIISERRDHKKYVVDVARYHQHGLVWVATASWDKKVFLYITRVDQNHAMERPVAEISVPTNPECLLFLHKPGEQAMILLVTRHDSTYLYYYSVPAVEQFEHQPLAAGALRAVQELPMTGKQNLMPHSSTWVTFSPSSVSICPTDSNIIAVATSSTPHMKLIVVRIIWPCASRAQGPNQGHTLQANMDLLNADEEESATVLHVNTFAPQSAYSTPSCVWRPDGSGIWVSSDDGALRGIELRSGGVVSVLTGGHDEGSKIRSLWAGKVQREEWLISGGYGLT